MIAAIFVILLAALYLLLSGRAVAALAALRS